MLSPVSSPGPSVPPGPPVSSPPDSVATRRFSSRPHHLFNVFLKVRHRKISQCSPNKDGGLRFEYTAYTRNFEKSLHLTRTLAARCRIAKPVHKNSLCFMEKFSGYSAAVLSVSLWLGHSGASTHSKTKPVYRRPTPGVDIPCRRYTGFRRHREVFAQSRYIGVRRYREVCAKPVYRLLTS